MIELVRRAAVVSLWAGVFLRCALGGLWFGGYTPPPLTSSTPRGLEWRSIKRIGPRIVALRLQVVIV